MTTDLPNTSPPARRLVIRSVALPAEHGGWGFLIEPILLGLLVAGTVNGWLLAVAAVGVFLIHQPLKITLKDRLKGRRPARTTWAERFTIGYGLLALIPLGVLLISTDRLFVLPMLGALPFALTQLVYDARNQSRRLVPELCGAFALAVTAPAIAILGGWEMTPALILWIVLALRGVASILYVRSRLRLERDQPHAPRPAWLAHLVTVGVMGGLAAATLTPWLGVVAFGVLLARAALGLSRHRKPRPAKVIGFQEIGYGLLTVLLVALGYRLGV
jgi:hypothetical protein